MPVIEVQRDSATRTPVQPRQGQSDVAFIDEMVQKHGASAVFIDGKPYSEAVKAVEAAATEDLPQTEQAEHPAEPAKAPKKSAKRSTKGGAQ